MCPQPRPCRRQLRRLCSANLLLPLEEVVLQHMLAPRWEKEAQKLLGGGELVMATCSRMDWEQG